MLQLHPPARCRRLWLSLVVRPLYDVMSSKFFAVACALAIIALLVHSVSREFMMQSMHRKAARIAQASSRQEPYTPDPEVHRLSMRADVLMYTGFALTLSAFGCMIVAMVRREHGWYLILCLLLMADIVAPMLL